MLANNFMKPEALGITAAEWGALTKVLGMLERAELVYRRPYDASLPNGFNMDLNWKSSECGTVGCIRGWCRDFMGDDVFPIERMTDRISELFIFTGINNPMEVIRKTVTPAQAAIALRNYLTTGEPRWAEALASE